MPYSNFLIRGQYVEMRDNRVVDLVSLFDAAYRAKISCDRDYAPWLADAISGWQKDCDLPPGCVIIRLDQWLNSLERVISFLQFIDEVEARVLVKTPYDRALVAEIGNLRDACRKAAR